MAMSAENNYALSERIRKELSEYDQSVFLEYLDCIWDADIYILEDNKIVVSYESGMTKYTNTLDLLADIY